MSGMSDSKNRKSAGRKNRTADFISLIQIVDQPITLHDIINRVKTSDSGCVATYVGLIRDNSHGHNVRSVEYRDEDGTARDKLIQLARELKEKWQINDIAIYHRVGVLNVGDINFLVAIAAGHRQEGFAACAWAVDRFKESLPTKKIETYIEN